MAKKTTESPQQLSFDFDDWLAPPAAPEPAPEQASISPRFALAELLNVRPAVIRAFLHGQLTPGRTQELHAQLLAAGLPV